ncbi:hypothetical protein [Streptomyces sp. B6B3]|uniref:hypothetical protein n=1 Tax=Streptomyces sp. B6B3 TaxID=3153570 RepID=UPI00325F49D3
MSGTHNEFSGTAHHVVQAGSVGSVHIHGQPSTVQALDGLPPRHGPLVGRDTELAAALRALEPKPELLGLAVIGQAGVGKTALALEAAHRVVGEGCFPGGVLYADLGGRDSERPVTTQELLAELLRMLGFPGDRLPTHRIGLTALLRTELVRQGERRGAVLIVLDNVSGDAHLAECLPPEGPHRVLVTSRAPLEIRGIVALRLAPLDAEHARAVLGPAGTASRADLDEIAQLCGRLPLALSVAAARLREGQESATLLLAALRSESVRLAELDMEPAFDVSYQALSPTDARLFRLLGLHPGTLIDATSAAALGGSSESETGQALRRLRRAHLLELGDTHGRVRFHDLTRLYARQRLADEPEAERGAALDRFLALCAQRVAGAGDEWFGQERRTLAGAVEVAMAAGLYDRVEPVAAPLARFLVRQARTVEALNLLRQMVLTAQRRGDLIREADLFLAMGTQYGNLHHREAAWTCVIAGHALHERRRVTATSSRELLGDISLEHEDHESAARHFRAAVKGWERLSDRRRLAIALSRLGEAYALLGRDTEAWHAFRRAVAIAHAAAEPYAACLAHLNLAKLAQGFATWPFPRDEPPADWESARFHASQALSLAHRSGDVVDVIGALIVASAALNGAGDGEPALTTARQAVRLAREHRLPHVEVAALVQESLVLEGLGRSDEAHERQTAAGTLSDATEAGGPPPGTPEPPAPSPPRLDRTVVLRSLLLPALGVAIALVTLVFRGWSWLWTGYGVLMSAALWGRCHLALRSPLEGMRGRAEEVPIDLAPVAAAVFACLASLSHQALADVLWWVLATFIGFADTWLREVLQKREERRASRLTNDI